VVKTVKFYLSCSSPFNNVQFLFLFSVCWFVEDSESKIVKLFQIPSLCLVLPMHCMQFGPHRMFCEVVLMYCFMVYLSWFIEVY